MFGNPLVRPFPEVENGVSYSGRCTSVAYADLDRDGDADAVVGDVNGKAPGGPEHSFVSVLFNAGDGVFRPGALYRAGRRPCAVELGDLDGDGDVDIATTDELDDSVSILLNNGDGTFAPPASHAVGDMPRSLKVADLDRDRDLDLIVLNTLGNDVSILLNSGGGAFTEVRVPVGGVTQRGDANLSFQYPGPFLAVGDLDGDGDADVAVPARGKVKLLLNDGSGGFALAPAHPAMATPDAYAVVIADLNGDLAMDVAATSHHGGGAFGPDVLSVMLGTGPAQFAPAVAYDAGWHPSPGVVQWTTSLSAGDVDGDGDPDLAVGHEAGSNVVLMRNRGDGTFAPKELVALGLNNWYVRFAEVSGDSRLDLGALTYSGRSTLSSLLNGGGGTVTSYATYPRDPLPCCVSEGWEWLEGADLDGDGDTDLVASLNASQTPHQVKVLLNDGNGAFDRIDSYALGRQGESTGKSVAVGDFNEDDIPDLAVCDAIRPSGFDLPGKVWILRGVGDATFGSPTPYQLDGLIPIHAVIADLNGDNLNDIAVWTVQIYPGNDLQPVDRRIVIMWNKGGGVFAFGPQLTVGTHPWPFPWGSVTALHLDANASLDLVATSGTRKISGQLRAFLNDGQGGFAIGQTLSIPPQAESIAIWRPNPSAPATLLVLHNHNFIDGVILEPYLSVWHNSSPGTLTPGPQYADATLITLGRLGAVTIPGTSEAGAFLPTIYQAIASRHLDGASYAQTAAHYGAGYWPTAVVLADFDGNGRPDMAVSNHSDDNVSVVLNRSCGSCFADCDGDGALTPTDFACFQSKFLRADPWADCNHDAQLTVADFGCFQTRFVQGCP